MMTGYGVKNVFGQSVVRIQCIIMLTVIARALRRHLMTEAALMMKPVAEVIAIVSMSEDVRVRDREAHEQEQTVKTFVSFIRMRFDDDGFIHQCSVCATSLLLPCPMKEHHHSTLCRGRS